MVMLPTEREGASGWVGYVLGGGGWSGLMVWLELSAGRSSIVMSGWVVGGVWVVSVVDVGVLWGEGEGGVGDGGRSSAKSSVSVGEGVGLITVDGYETIGRVMWACAPSEEMFSSATDMAVSGGGVAVSVPRSRSVDWDSRGELVRWGGRWV